MIQSPETLRLIKACTQAIRAFAAFQGTVHFHINVHVSMPQAGTQDGDQMAIDDGETSIQW